MRFADSPSLKRSARKAGQKSPDNSDLMSVKVKRAEQKTDELARDDLAHKDKEREKESCIT